jgi:hypothetical protein
MKSILMFTASLFNTQLLISALMLSRVLPATSAEAKGVCSTGSYKTCVACCATNPAININSRDRCASQCSDFRDSPLQKELADKKKQK